LGLVRGNHSAENEVHWGCRRSPSEGQRLIHFSHIRFAVVAANSACSYIPSWRSDSGVIIDYDGSLSANGGLSIPREARTIRPRSKRSIGGIVSSNKPSSDARVFGSVETSVCAVNSKRVCSVGGPSSRNSTNSPRSIVTEFGCVASSVWSVGCSVKRWIKRRGAASSNNNRPSVGNSKDNSGHKILGMVSVAGNRAFFSSCSLATSLSMIPSSLAFLFHKDIHSDRTVYIFRPGKL